MITKETIKQIIGTAMLFDEKKRFDGWHGDEAKEWVEMVAEAIWSAQHSVQSDLGWTCGKCGTDSNVGYRCSWCESPRPSR